MVELLGFVDPVTNEPLAKVEHPPSATLTDRVTGPEGVPADDWNARRKAIFSTRRITTSIKVSPGQSVVLILGETEKNPWFQLPSATKTVVAIVTARLLDRNGSPQNSDGKVAPGPVTQKKIDELLFGSKGGKKISPGGLAIAEEVPGKPGYVRSPFAPDKGYIDVRGYPSGAEAKCPYSGKMFVVP